MIKGAKSLEKKLNALSDKIQSKTLNVGFINGATYPEDGQQVATVAFYNEYGTTKIPSRPFFRRMISQEKGTWAKKLQGAIKHTNYNLEKSMGLLGNDIEGALRQSIINTNEPPNSAKTIEKKGFNKPLIDTSLMIKSITSEVLDGR